MNLNVWFLPVIISFGISLLHLVSPRMGRKYRRWVSLFGGFAILVSCLYSLYINNDYLYSWQNFGLLFGILISAISLSSISFSQWYNPDDGYAYDSLLFLFIGAMNGVVLSHSFIALFVYWEIMTIASFFLVLFNDTIEARQASVKYIIMTGAGSMMLLFGIIGILVGTTIIGDNIVWEHIFFASILIGTGIKAGIIPLHTWLPDAHPAAPTPVSSMLSGIMIKTGVYAFIKLYFGIFNPSWSLSWDVILTIIGVLTLVGGVFLALIQSDIKRLLAYHSISQIGYIFLGISCGTSIGLVGAIYHTINHAIFKSLLFLGAGVLIKTTGSRYLQDYGGLAKKLPFTFAVMTVASMSISGIPPFNGFISKWIIYQALLTKGNSLSIFAMVAALLGSVLTLASFIKVLNDSFMGVREKELKGERLESSPFMNIPMFILALGCFIFGVFPGLVLERIVFPSIGEYVNLNISHIKLVGMYGWLVIVLFIFVLVFTKFFKKVRIVKNFVGGELLSSQDTSFDGTHFYGTIKDIPLIKIFYLAEERGALDIYQRALQSLPKTGRFFKVIGVRMVDNVYHRGNHILNRWVSKLKVIQNGLLAKYIIWIFAGIILLMEVIRR
ncbi:hypothetical protein M0P98_00350 [bacterium]|nr:hypothetical protein [bacterium]